MSRVEPKPIIVGIDPAVGKGSSRIAIACLSADGGNFLAGHSFHVSSDKLSIPEVIQSISTVFPLVNPNEDKCKALVVEGQRVYPGGKVSPQSIVALAQMAGALLALGMAILKPGRSLMPYPSDVSTLDKETRHKQVLYKMDCSLAYVAERTTHWEITKLRDRPTIVDSPPLSQFPLDIMDAVCLARYSIR